MIWNNSGGLSSIIVALGKIGAGVRFMPGKAGVVIPCLPYHITQRGNNRRREIFVAMTIRMANRWLSAIPSSIEGELPGNSYAQSAQYTMEEAWNCAPPSAWRIPVEMFFKF